MGKISGRLDAIDGLRGIAALTVAVLHFQNLFGFPESPLKWGGLPVHLFFILSGYILSRKYEAGLATGSISAKTFVLHRISRLWPLHVFALCSMIVLEWIATYKQLANFHVLGPSDTTWALFLNLLLVHCSGLYPSPNFDKPSWSISSEFIFNLIWMAVVIRGGWNSVVAWACVVLGSLYVWSLGHDFNVFALSNPYYILNTGVVTTALGFSLGWLLYRLQNSGFKLGHPNLVAAATTAALVAILWDYSQLVEHYIDFLIVLFLFPVLVFLALDSSNFLSKCLASFPMRWLGRISFSIYLLHLPIASGLSYLLLVGLYPEPPWIGFLFIAVLIAISLISYFVIETVGISLMRRAMGERRPS